MGLDWPEAVSAPQSWTSIVEAIRAEDPAGIESLYRFMRRGCRRYLYNRLGAQDADDALHDVLVIAVEGIRKHGLRNPERLPEFLSTVTRRYFFGVIREKCRVPDQLAPWEEMGFDPAPDPEHASMEREREAAATRKIAALARPDMAIVIRFYLRDESAAEIQRDLGMTETQFRLHKWRALDRLKPGYRDKLRAEARKRQA